METKYAQENILQAMTDHMSQITETNDKIITPMRSQYVNGAATDAV